MNRVFQSLAVIAAVAIAIIAVREINMRWDEEDVAMGPTLAPSATELPTPEPDEQSPVETPGEQTEIPDTPTVTAAAETPTATVEATEEPTVEPTEEPSIPTPTPSGDAMPHTGGGAVGGGIALMAVAACVHLFLRRSY